MFKSIFTKYILTFILIIVVIFAILMSIIVALVDNHSNSLQAEVVKVSAKSAQSYIELGYLYSRASSFDGYINENSENVLNILSAVVSNSEGISFLIADENGKLLLYATDSERGDFKTTEYVPPIILNKLTNLEDVTTLNTSISRILKPSRVSFSTPIIKDGKMEGAIIAVSSNNKLAELLDKMVNALLISSMWVMVAALIAVYFLTEMITGPLRAMSRAAKKLANGNFDVRIPVRGKDEVAELAESFNHMADSLQNLETMRNTFMANVSHDLRTPMTTISGFIDNILIGAIPPEEEHYYLLIIKEEVKRLSRLVSSLLDISRIQAGDRKLTMSSFDICETARLILISFEKEIESKKLSVDFECDEERIFVKADRDAIYQVLYNICENAVKFASDEGQYKITIKRTEINREKKVLISVYNQGIGISADDIPFVFERFYKADKSRGIDKKGVGLGMFISKTIIDAHNESIWVKSKFEEYCEFSFTLTPDNMSNN